MKRVMNYTEIRCDRCNNDFAYQIEDIKVENDKKYVICPICGTKHFVE